MASEITMPQLSDTMTEGTLVKWHKKEGDKVKEGEKIADVETDKAVMEMESFESGVISKLVAKEGEKVKVGGVLAVVGAPGESAMAAPPQAQQQPQVVQSATVAAVAAPGARMVKSAAPGAANDDRVKISPLARRLASERGIDLQLIQGTGPGGRIVQQDILDFKPDASMPAAQQVKATPVADKPAPNIVLASRGAMGGKEVIPLSKIRSVIAQRLQQSKQQIPHFYEAVDIDMEAVVGLRQRMNAGLESQGIRLSVADFIAKAVASALVQHQTVNSHFNGSEITQFDDVHLGMAVALPNGLIVPVLRNINQMGLAEIRVRSADLVDRARNQRLKQDEMTGATFTVSNLGTYGVREFSAIINPPEVGILAIGNAEKRAVVYKDQLAARMTMTVCLSADHRVVDGATAAEFLRTLKGLLEEPGMMLV